MQAIAVFLVVFAAAQFVRPGRANRPTDANRTIQAHAGTAGELGRGAGSPAATVIRTTRRGRGTHRSPVSWLMAYGAAEGRKAVNFSEWAAYSPEQQRALLAASCDDARTGKMPGPYTFLRPEARLSDQDIETICVAARQAEAPATDRQ